jgi:glycosyltransferase involved in cell wall biosynthesis
MQRVAATLHATGYRVTMVGRDFDEALPLAGHPWEEVRLRPSKSAGPRMYYDFNRQLEQLLPNLEADLYCAVDLDTVMAVSRVAQAGSIPWIFDAHEYFTEVPELIGRPLKRWVWRWMRRYVRSAATAITVNGSLARILSTHYHKAFAVVRNVPSHTHKQCVLDKPDKRIIYQGAINQGRWVEQYIEMMSSLPADVSLHLYGDGDKMPVVRQLAAASPRSSDIHLHGKVAPTQLSQASQLGWLGVNVLDVESKSYYYSLANKFFDYMHAGLPSINSRLPEYEAILAEHEVGTCIDNTITALTKAVLNYYHSPELYTTHAAATRDASMIYSWQQEQQVLLRLIEQQLLGT